MANFRPMYLHLDVSSEIKKKYILHEIDLRKNEMGEVASSFKKQKFIGACTGLTKTITVNMFGSKVLLAFGTSNRQTYGMHRAAQINFWVF